VSAASRPFPNAPPSYSQEAGTLSRLERGSDREGDKEFTRRVDTQNLANSLVFLFAKHLHTNDLTYHHVAAHRVIDLRALFFCIFFFGSCLTITTLASSHRPYLVISQARLYPDSTNHPPCLVVSVLVCLSSRKSLHSSRHSGAHELSCKFA
jgi:hypothetical protein